MEQAELERSRSVYRRRRRRSEPDTDQGTELGVQSAYEVVSEVDLDFTPDLDEERQRIAVFQVSLTFSLATFPENQLES